MMVAMQKLVVTPCSATVSSAVAGSHSAIMWFVVRLTRNGVTVTWSPATWKQGFTVRPMSLPDHSIRVRMASALVERFSWVCLTPFGRPVVPEVYMMSASSACLRGWISWWPACSATSVA